MTEESIIHRMKIIFKIKKNGQIKVLKINIKNKLATIYYEKEAVYYKNPPSSSDLEFWRKVRVANRSINGILKLKHALNPFKYGFYSLALLSHKALRYLVPFLLLIAFVINIFLSLDSDFYKIILLLQIPFYVLAFIGYKARNINFGRVKILYGPFYFCLANFAVLLGAIYLFCGKRITTWRPERE